MITARVNESQLSSSAVRMTEISIIGKNKENRLIQKTITCTERQNRTPTFSTNKYAITFVRNQSILLIFVDVLGRKMFILFAYF